MKPSHVFRSAHHFLVEGDAPTTSVMEEALTLHAFREAVSPSKEARYGWCNPQAIFSTDFSDLNTWQHNNYVVLTLRQEQRKIQKLRLDASLKASMEKWCEEHARERCPLGVRAEIREAVELELLQQTPPTVRAWSAVWNTTERWVAVQGCPTGVLDVFRKRFHQTFGLVLSEAGFFDDEDQDASAPFRAWLLRRVEEGRDKLDLGEGEDVSWWVDGDVVLSGEGGRVSAPWTSVAASSALVEGVPIERMPLIVKRSDREYPCVIGKNGRVMGLKLPTVTKGAAPEEQLYEAAFLYEEHTYLRMQLFERFLNELKVQGSQGEAADQRWRKERAQGGWDALMERLRAREEGYA